MRADYSRYPTKWEPDEEEPEGGGFWLFVVVHLFMSAVVGALVGHATHSLDWGFAAFLYLLIRK